MSQKHKIEVNASTLYYWPLSPPANSKAPHQWGVNLEEMENLEGRGDQVSEVDPLDVSLPTDQANSLLGSEVSNVVSSFSGFEGASASMHEQVPQQQEKSASSSSQKNQHSFGKKTSERLRVF